MNPTETMHEDKESCGLVVGRRVRVPFGSPAARPAPLRKRGKPSNDLLGVLGTASSLGVAHGFDQRDVAGLDVMFMVLETAALCGFFPVTMWKKS